MKTVFNEQVSDSSKEKIFFGNDLSLQRYDKLKYPIFLDLFKRQMEFFWRPEEINISKDRIDFEKLTDTERFVFVSNLSFQTAADSFIGRGINTISKYVTIPELEACMSFWQAMETIHSYSYTYIIKNVFPEPEKVFDSIVGNKEIVSRAKYISSSYDELMKNPKNEKEQLYFSLLSTNVLESVAFYVSFACSFYFGEQGKMVGNASILKLINRDENLHVAITQDLIKILRENKEEGFADIIKDTRDKAVEFFKVAVKQEKDWASYLFSKGSLAGLNEKILHQYIEWLAQKRMDALGLPSTFNVKVNPIGGWLRNWVDSQSVQVAPQETEIISYKVKAVNRDLNDIDLGSL